jgi:threonine synthase
MTSDVPMNVMQRIASLACIRCHATHAVSVIVNGCPACASEAPSNLRVAYRPELRTRWRFGRDAHPGSTLWRFADMLPVAAKDAISLGEGGTPLVDAPRMAARLGLDRLLIKDETRNPTWSYKDRLSTVAVSAARQFGARVLATSSSGNAGASLAAYAARAGLPCVVLTMADTAGPMLAQIRKYGAAVVPLADKADRWPMLAEGVRRYGWFATSPYAAPVVGSHPIGIEGYKTLAYEIVEQLGGLAPDWCAMPICYGDALAGLWQGFCDLKETGVIDRLPRLIAAEAYGSLAATLRVGGDRMVDKVAPFQTLALSIGATQSAFQALQALRQSNGCAVPLGNDGLAAMQEELAAREGLFAELSSVMPLLAVRKLRAEGTIASGETVVAVVTASGLKDLDRSTTGLEPANAVAGSFDAVVQFLREQCRFDPAEPALPRE